MNISTQQSNGCLNLPELSIEAQRTVRRSTQEIQLLTRKSVCNAIEIGGHLVAIKEVLGHGHFRHWLNSEFSSGSSTASKLMQVFHVFKAEDVSDLNIALTALYRLASPSTPRSAVDEAIDRAKKGECVTPSVATEIMLKHSDRPIDVDAVELPEQDGENYSDTSLNENEGLNFFDLAVEESPSVADGQLVNLRCSIQYPVPEEDIRLLLSQMFLRQDFFKSVLEQAKELSSANVHKMHV